MDNSKNIVRQSLLVVSTFVVLYYYFVPDNALTSFLLLSFLLLIAIAVKAFEQVYVMLFFAMLPAFWLLPRYITGIALMQMLLPMFVSTLIVLPFSRLRKSLSFMKLGKIDKFSWILMGITIPLSVGSLLLWAYWADYFGVGVGFMRQFEALPRWFLFVGIVPIFALANAAAEEIVFRGVIQETFHRTFKSVSVTVGLQATIFAAAHFLMGFPNGIIGFLMVFVWGSMIGYLRHRTKGLLAPYIVHVAADGIIALVLAAQV